MKNDLIINLSVNGRENYEQMQQGLTASIAKLWDGHYWCFNYFPAYATPHSEVPYKFKFDIIEHARKQGYDRIFWLDSSMRLLGDISQLLTNSKTGVVLFENAGHPLKNYISDDAISISFEHLFLDVPTVESIPQVWGGAFGLDLTKYEASNLLNDVFYLASAGAFKDGGSKREGFVAHRHDQACLSVLAAYYKIDLLPYGVIAARKDVTSKTVIQYGD